LKTKRKKPNTPKEVGTSLTVNNAGYYPTIFVYYPSKKEENTDFFNRNSTGFPA